MRRLTEIEKARKELEMSLRHQANVIRFRWLAEVMPAMLEEFDRRVLGGKPYRKALPSVDNYVKSAVEEALREGE